MGPIVNRLATNFDGRAVVGMVNVNEQGALTRAKPWPGCCGC